MNSQVVRLRDQGGNLTLTIPRQLWRELGLVRRGYVRIFRSGPRSLTITDAEVTLRAHDDVSKSRPHPVTRS
jgi:hypothetical protein